MRYVLYLGLFCLIATCIGCGTSSSDEAAAAATIAAARATEAAAVQKMAAAASPVPPPATEVPQPAATATETPPPTLAPPPTEPAPAAETALSGPAAFTFYAIYDRIVDTDHDGVRIYRAAMSDDGERLIFAGGNNETGDVVLYTVNADGTDLTQVSLPDLRGRGIDALTINRDGSRAFFSAGAPPDVYKVEGATATRILTTQDYDELNGCYDVDTTADGDYVYFREDRDDLWRVHHSGGAPEIVIADTEVPREDSKGRAGWAVGEFAVAADGGTIAFVLRGYQDPDNHYGVSVKEELFVLNSSGYRQLSNDDSHVGKEYLDISGDGAIVVFSAGLPQNQWYTVRSDGGAGAMAVEDYWANFGGVNLTYDGAQMFYADAGANGGRLTNIDGSGGLDLFPGAPVYIGVGNHASISDDGRRIAFIRQYSSWPFKDALYVGHLDNRDAVASAPTIHDITFDPPIAPTDGSDAGVVLTSQISDPQGVTDVERTSTGELIDGRREGNTQNLPIHFSLAVHDDGRAPDKTAGDGVFSSVGRPAAMIDQIDQVTVRVAAQDGSKTVVVADALLGIGSPPAQAVVSASPTPRPSVMASPTLKPSADPAGGMRLIVAEVHAKTGDEIEVPLRLENATNVGALGLSINYEPDLLEVLDVKPGPMAVGALVTDNLLAEQGEIRVSLVTPEALQGNDTVVILVFQVRSSGRADLSVTRAEATHIETLEAISLEVTDGAVVSE